MSGFTEYHQSNNDSRPVGLYKFVWGETTWTYCTADRPVVWGGDTYVPVAASEEPLKQGAGNEAEFVLTLPDDLPVVALYQGTPPSNRVSLTVRRLEYDDPSGEAPIAWIGPIVSIRKPEQGSARIVSKIIGLRRGGLRMTWGRGCQHFLFHHGCFAVKADFANVREIMAISGNELTLDIVHPGDGTYFNGGFIEWDADGLGTIESRAIEREVGTLAVKLFGRADGLEVGMAVTLYPGCPHTPEGCETIFNNLANYDGADFMKGESLFSGKALV